MKPAPVAKIHFGSGSFQFYWTHQLLFSAERPPTCWKKNFELFLLPSHVFEEFEEKGHKMLTCERIIFHVTKIIQENAIVFVLIFAGNFIKMRTKSVLDFFKKEKMFVSFLSHCMNWQLLLMIRPNSADEETF